MVSQCGTSTKSLGQMKLLLNRNGSDFNWRVEESNWMATYLEGLLNAKGVIKILNPKAEESLTRFGRGMWRENDAIEYIYKDNPLRLRR